MNFKEISELSGEERTERLRGIELELMKERAQIASGASAQNPGKIRMLRRTIARIRTIENQK